MHCWKMPKYEARICPSFLWCILNHLMGTSCWELSDGIEFSKIAKKLFLAEWESKQIWELGYMKSYQNYECSTKNVYRLEISEKFSRNLQSFMIVLLFFALINFISSIRSKQFNVFQDLKKYLFLSCFRRSYCQTVFRFYASNQKKLCRIGC